MKGIIRFNRARQGLLVVLAASILGAGSSAASANTPAGGSFKFWRHPLMPVPAAS